MNVTVEMKKPSESYGDYEGFTKVAEIEWQNKQYQFDITGVWVRDSDKTLWFAHDSGCSCPSYWESTTELERLFDLAPLEERYRHQISGESYGHVNPDDWQAFKAAVEEAFAALAAQ